MRKSEFPLLAVGLLLAACAGASGTAPSSERGGDQQKPGNLPEDHPARALIGATVYDARGATQVCASPQPSCPDAPRDVDFLDRCRLRGFQVRQCGCAQLCTGNVAQEKAHYNVQGKRVECAPERPDCTPRDTSAAFQDGCTDAGHKLVVCGCEWLCDGPPRAGGSAP
jgi:hypothetical protein